MRASLAALTKAVILFLFAPTIPVALAADIYPVKNNSGRNTMIVIEGEIAPGDYDNFDTVFLQNIESARMVGLYSPGGDLKEALKIAGLVRDLKLFTSTARARPDGTIRTGDEYPRNPANNMCASSCFFIWAAGTNRGGNVLGLHRPYLEAEEFQRISPDQATAVYDRLEAITRTFAEETNIQARWVDLMFSTPADDMYWIPQKDISQYLDGYPPALDEWLAGQCANVMSLQERALLQQTYKTGKPPGMTDAQLDALGNKYWDLEACKTRNADKLSGEARWSWFYKRHANCPEKFQELLFCKPK